MLDSLLPFDKDYNILSQPALHIGLMLSSLKPSAYFEDKLRLTGHL